MFAKEFEDLRVRGVVGDDRRFTDMLVDLNGLLLGHGQRLSGEFAEEFIVVGDEDGGKLLLSLLEAAHALCDVLQ